MPRRLDGAATRRALGVLFLIVAGAQLLLGSIWTAQNLGSVPGYGDTFEYLDLARTLQVDAYRGIGYPAVVAAVNRLTPPHDLLTWRPPPRLPAPTGALALQVVQLAAAAGAVGYFVRVFFAGVSRRTRLWLLALLISDPLVVHFNLSLLTDALALSASLVCCAALAELVVDRSRRWRPAALLVAAGVAASTLRAEKWLVLAATAVVSVAVWSMVTRAEPAAVRGAIRRRAVGAAALAIAASLLVVAGQARVRVAGTRMGIGDWIANERVVFPHLEAVYDELPASVQARISRDAARRYDSHVNEARLVIDEASGSDAALRHALTREMAAVVVRERWPAIVADSVGDTIENVVASPSFYVRLGLGSTVAPDDRRDFGVARWTYSRIAEYHPVTSAWYLASAVVLLLVGSILACLSATRLARETVMRWTPAAAFVLMNACAFAATADLVHVRYVLYAHVVLLAIVYHRALAVAWERER